MELDEEVWNSWLRRGQERGRRNAAARWKMLSWIAAVGMLAAVWIWPEKTSFAFAVRCVAVACALILILPALRSKTEPDDNRGSSL